MTTSILPDTDPYSTKAPENGINDDVILTSQPPKGDKDETHVR